MLENLLEKRMIYTLALTIFFSYFFSNASAANPPQESTLQWTKDNHPNNLCRGYYLAKKIQYAPDFLAELNKPEQPHTRRDNLVHIATSEGLLKRENPSVLNGNVVITQLGRQLTADKIYLHRNIKTGQLETADIPGTVEIREPGKLIIGNNAHLKMQEKAGTLEQALYRVVLDNPKTPAQKNEPAGTEASYRIQSLVGWGRSAKITQLKAGRYDLEASTFTTCPPDMNDWKLQAKEVKLDDEAGRGTAKDVIIRVKNIPVLYTPYLSFPTDKRRKSGLLFPTMSSGTEKGFDITMPYYFNLAPNYDATFSPRLMTKRGLMLGGHFRYLTATEQGQLHLNYLNRDQEFVNFKKQFLDPSFVKQYYPARPRLVKKIPTLSDHRGFLSFADYTQWNAKWSSSIDFSTVTDDYYFQDFGSATSTITTNQLLQRAEARYNSGNWSTIGRLQAYQTLNPINRPKTDTQYSRLPQLIVSGNLPTYQGINQSLSAEYVHFVRPQGPEDLKAFPTADRVNTIYKASLPIRRSSGYLVPALQLYGTQYMLGNTTPGKPTEISRIIPIFNLDSGLYFDRHLTWSGHGYRQTLEPRLFYVYVPLKNQDNIPIFDSALQPFSYAHLFRVNRFSGSDKIGDTHQVTFALTSRLLEQRTGQEKWVSSIGQIFYFKPRVVRLNPGTADPDATKPYSPIAGETTYRLTPQWFTRGSAAWDPLTARLQSSSISIQYRPDTGRLLNLGYNFVRDGDLLTGPQASPNSAHNNLSQTDVSFVWPIQEQWTVLARWNYNLSHQHPQRYLVGLEYNNCCWAVRLVAERHFKAIDGSNGQPLFDKNIFLQFQLKGLGNIGNNRPDTILASSIPGYRDNFGAVTPYA